MENTSSIFLIFMSKIYIIWLYSINIKNKEMYNLLLKTSFPVFNQRAIYSLIFKLLTICHKRRWKKWLLMTEKTLSGEETVIAEVSEAPGKCTPQFVLTVVLKLRYLLYLTQTGRFIAEIVSPTTGDFKIIYTEC